MKALRDFRTTALLSTHHEMDEFRDLFGVYIGFLGFSSGCERKFESMKYLKKIHAIE